MTLRLTGAQVREIDRRAIDEYHIPGIVLMENASRGAADIAMEMLVGIDHPSVDIFCGGGNNGGDGLAIARHLHNRGVDVRIRAGWTKEPAGDAAINWQIVQRMRLPIMPIGRLGQCDLLIDALFGTGLSRAIEGSAADVIAGMNKSDQPILAIDLPSGLDCDTGEARGICVGATRTVTFAAEKIGFANPASRQFTGPITVVDIGVPPELIAAIAAT